jgi:lambda family phage portal protein
VNAIDRAIAFFSPLRGARRAYYREVLRSYDAAQFGKRRIGFGARAGSANTAIGPALKTLRERARHMVRNTPHGHAIVDVMVRHLIGSGITPIWNSGSDRVDRQVGLLWEEQVKRSDVEGEETFYSQQAIAARGMIEAGEVLSRYIDLPYGSDSRTPLRLQLLEGDHIDSSRDGLNIEGRKVRLGVALGRWAERQGYYLFPEHPGEPLAAQVSSLVGADQLKLLLRPLRIGQLRGVSWLAPILLPAKDYADLVTNTIVKTAVEAAFSGFVLNNPEGGIGGGGILPVKTNPITGEREFLPEPGMLTELKPGQDIKFAEPKTSSQFEPIALNTLQAMAIGAGLTYHQATGDLRQANYSSLRAGNIEHRILVEQVQFHNLIPRFCEPFADRFVDRCILAGTLRPRADGYPREWAPPEPEPVDPKKDLEADIAAVRAGRVTPQQFIARWGYAWRKVIEDSATFWSAVDKARIAFDIDPRRPINGGVAAAPADAANADATIADAGNPTDTTTATD